MKHRRVINDLLDFETIRSSTKPMRREPVDVDAMIISVTKMFQSSARNKMLKLTCEQPKQSAIGSPIAVSTATGSPAASTTAAVAASTSATVVVPVAAERTKRMILGDEHNLKRVLMNIVSNSIKFTSTGAVTIAARSDAAAETMSFVVTDTGCGIPAEFKDLLFHTVG